MRAMLNVRIGLIIVAAIPVAAVAQLGLPQLPSVDLGRTTGNIVDAVRVDGLPLVPTARDLALARVDRLSRFVRANRQAVDIDEDRNPAVRGVLIATGIDAEGIVRAGSQGFRLIERTNIEGLDLSYARFAVPKGRSLGEARRVFAKIAGGADVSVDHLYFASGTAVAAGAVTAPSRAVSSPAIGLIDGGIAAHPSLSSAIEQRGFAPGAPLASAHGTAVASLIIGRGAVKGAAPGAALLAADVYGNGPGGGSATAIAQAFGWMAARRVPVVTVSLVGPDNGLLRAAVRAAQARGVIIVAAVGNDGPAAPPAYPASFSGVVAVTGVDSRERVLPEAGKALHIDFAAPGANMKGASIGGGLTTLRGTSYAAPLVAGRLSAHYRQLGVANVAPALRALIVEAKDLGKKGHDRVFGHGLICGICVTR